MEIDGDSVTDEFFLPISTSWALIERGGKRLKI
jgi:hypothetical protein